MNQDPDVAIKEVDGNNNSSSDEMTIESSSETINRNRRRGVRLGGMLNSFIEKKHSQPSQYESIEKELHGYMREPVLDFKCDPLMWWREIAPAYPSLLK